MSADLSMHAAGLERLSALVDGELDDASTTLACRQWRDDPSSRASWHEYQLIGDLLRSEDLASTPQRDSAFLSALRLKLADEPVVLAPQPLPSTVSMPLATPLPSSLHLPEASRVAGLNRGRRLWRATSAVAVGFVVVAGVVMVTRGPGALPSRADDAGLTLLAAPTVPVARAPVAPAALPAPVPVALAVTEPQVLVANGKLIRDVRLDRYLSAHQQFAGSAALGVPSAYLRIATADAANR